MTIIVLCTACGIYESSTVVNTSSFPLSEQHYYTVLLSVFGMVANVGMYIPAVIYTGHSDMHVPQSNNVDVLLQEAGNVDVFITADGLAFLVCVIESSEN